MRTLFFLTVIAASTSHLLAQRTWAGWVGGNFSAGPAFTQSQNYNHRNNLGTQIKGEVSFPLYYQKLRISAGGTVEQFRSQRDIQLKEGIITNTQAWFLMTQLNVEYKTNLDYRKKLDIAYGTGIAMRIKTQETNHWSSFKSQYFPTIWRNETVLIPVFAKLIKNSYNKSYFIGATAYLFHQSHYRLIKGWQANSLHLNAGVCWYPRVAVHRAPSMGRINRE